MLEPFWLLIWPTSYQFLTFQEYEEWKQTGAHLHVGAPRQIFRSCWTEAHWKELERQKIELLL